MSSSHLSLTISGELDDEENLSSEWEHQEDRIHCDMDEVIEGIFIGSVRCTSRPDILTLRGIQCAINASMRPVSLPGTIDVMTVDLKDDDKSEPSALHDLLQRCHDFLADAVRKRRPVLVFCHRGISRSALIVGTYLMGRCAELERSSRSDKATPLQYCSEFLLSKADVCL